jgi:hypothetical protein
MHFESFILTSQNISFRFDQLILDTFPNPELCMLLFFEQLARVFWDYIQSKPAQKSNSLNARTL